MTTSAHLTFAFSNEIVTSHGVIFSLCVTYPDPLFEGRIHEASCRRGTGAAPAGKGLTQPSSPGRARAASSVTRSRPGPTTVKGLKAKMPRWCAARRGRDVSRPGPGAPGPPGSYALPDRSGEIQTMRLVARHPPRFSRETEEKGMRAPPGPEHEQGP